MSIVARRRGNEGMTDNDQDRAIEQLQRMAGVGSVRMGFTLNSPEFAVLNADARVKALRHQVGLPE